MAACGYRSNDFYHGKDPTEVFFIQEHQENFSVEENFLGNFSVVGKNGVSEDFNVAKNPDRELGHFNQSKEVIKVKTIKKVDILWSIDNSRSMGRYQEALADNFSLFIEDFAQKDIDFKMGIITTDSAINKDTDNKLNSAELKKNKQSFIDDFKNKVKVGMYGSAIERSFQMVKRFFEQNTSWNRSDALLVVIFLSDEKEGASEIIVKKPVKEYTQAIVKSKGGNVENVRVFAICNHGMCLRFKTMAESTDGLIRYFACASERACSSKDYTKSSFAEISKELGESIVSNLTKLETVFPLQSTPTDASKLKVDVNGTAVPRDTTETEGWNYDSVANAIEFFGNSIPSENSAIKVYEEGVVADTFCLSNSIESGEVDSLVVEVDGVTVPRDTSESNGWNYDRDNNCVEFFGGSSPAKGADVNISLPGEIDNHLCLKNKLNINHLDKVKVTKGSSVVPRDTAKNEGWDYNHQSNCLEFFGSHALGEGEVISISLGLNSHFCLNQNFDLNKLNELNVVIGGQTIPRDTTGTMGWDYNRGNHCIELYGDHGLKAGLPVKISWGQTSRFCLNRPLDESKLETVEIKVDGRVVKRGGEGVGWDYDSATNCISFFGDHHPGDNSKLEITYTPDYERRP